MLETLIKNHLLVLLAIIFIGYILGNIKIKGISFGSSACLFVAILAGAYGAEIPQVITNLGIVFFVYSIGLQAGPQFFRLFNRRGLKFAFLGIFTVVIGALSALLFAIPLKIKITQAVGIFAGAMTSTPALASAINAIDTFLPGLSAQASIGYAIAYPFGLVSEILFVQIVPKLLSKKIRKEREEEALEREQSEFRTHQYRVTNTNVVGKTVNEIDIHQFSEVNLTRYKRGDKIYFVTPETKFELDDIVVAVGHVDELAKFRVLFGDEVNKELPNEGPIDIRDIVVSSSKLIGKTLREMRMRETYGITVSRIYRGETTIPPKGCVALEVGDMIRVVGMRDSVEKFTSLAGAEKRRLDDTNILILALGMLVGTLIGEIPVQIGDFVFKLGLAGGPLFVALILSHFGKIGKYSVKIPNATKFFLREIGLIFFLIGIGVKTGHEILASLQQQNMFNAFLLGIIVSMIAMFATMFMIHNVFKVPLVPSLGALCGAKTSSPSLGVLIKTVDDDSPAVTYAAVYPVAVICLTLVGQILVWAGKGILGY